MDSLAITAGRPPSRHRRAGFPVVRIAAWLAIVLLAACARRDDASPSALVESSVHAPERSRVTRRAPSDAKTPRRNASDEFFASQKVVSLRLRVEEPQLARLRQEPRTYVRAVLVENDATTYEGIGVKLKGAAGSFRGVDDRPALTLNMNKFRDKQTFHALDKFHLNNSVQDPTYACESICSDLSLAAGVPAARVSYARVWINDRDLGLYVLKEGFDRPFLKRHFAKSNGNLYDGGFVQDIDATLEKDLGDGPDDLSDLKALAAACRHADPMRRWALLENALNIDEFVRFMAIEQMTCHWDGYTRNRNNYRIYFDPADGRAQFLPHGMDQMFADPGFPILDMPPSMVGAAVMQNPQWRTLYRKRVEELLPEFSAEALARKVDAIRARLQPVLAAISQDADRGHAERCRELRERMIARAANLREQIRRADPSPAKFDEQGRLNLAEWEPRQETQDSRLERVERDGKVEYTIEAGPSGSCLASWRCRVLLSQGRYRIETQVKTAGVTATGDDKGQGAGVRISGGMRQNSVTGDKNWTRVAQEFVVTEPARDVELVAELRATKGRASFQAPLQLIRIKE